MSSGTTAHLRTGFIFLLSFWVCNFPPQLPRTKPESVFGFQVSMEALPQYLRRRAGHLKVPITMPQPKRVAALVLNGAVEFKTA